jgi:hypothetical protein
MYTIVRYQEDSRAYQPENKRERAFAARNDVPEQGRIILRPVADPEFALVRGSRSRTETGGSAPDTSLETHEPALPLVCPREGHV